jgi:hypothetical protein
MSGSCCAGAYASMSNFNGDYRAAYEHLSKKFLEMERQFCAVWGSRFFEISRFEADSEICLRQVAEEHISRSVDMADCEPDFFMLKRFYVDDDGEIQPVTIGRQERFSNGVEQPFHFASSAIDGPFVGFAQRTPVGPRWTGKVEL